MGKYSRTASTVVFVFEVSLLTTTEVVVSIIPLLGVVVRATRDTDSKMNVKRMPLAISEDDRCKAAREHCDDIQVFLIFKAHRLKNSSSFILLRVAARFYNKNMYGSLTMV